MEEQRLKKLTYKVIGAAYEVRKTLGPYLYENTYEIALQKELELRGIKAIRQHPIKIIYKGIEIDHAKALDLLVEDEIAIELKALDFMGSHEMRQLLSYMKFGNFRIGYLMNFGAKDFCPGIFRERDSYMDKGIYRFVNNISDK